MKIQGTPALLTRGETAALLRIHQATLDKWVLAGRIPPPIKLGGAIVRYDRDALLKHLENSATAKPCLSRTPVAQRTTPKKGKRSKKRTAVAC